MKLLTYQKENILKPAIFLDDGFRDISSIIAKQSMQSMEDIVRSGDRGRELILEAVLSNNFSLQAIDNPKIMAPLSKPSKIIAIGLNYHDHAIEVGAAPPKQPVIFSKFASSITGPFEEVRWSRTLTNKVDFEVELGVVIGSQGRNIDESKALDHVFGYMIVNDLSARDLQFADHSGQWDFGKSLDGFCPCGPYLVTKEEVPDPQNLELKCSVNGQVLQKSNTAKMLFNVCYLISYISRGITLEPGDIIATGTPAGVGLSQDPQIFLNDGDECVAEVEGLGEQKNKMRIY